MNCLKHGYDWTHDKTCPYCDVERLTAEGKRMRDALERTAILMREMGTNSGQTIATGWVLGMASTALVTVSGSPKWAKPPDQGVPHNTYVPEPDDSREK